MSLLKRIFQSRSPAEKAVDLLYGAIMTQSRQPAFYRDFGVPDTLDGRFDMLALHVYMLVHRLQGEDKTAGELARLLPERMFRELDRALRENGISDMGVPRRVKKMANAFYGRASAYENSRESRDELVDALARNVFPGQDAPEGAGRLADYMIASMARLEAQELAQLMQGTPDFADPEAGS